MGSPADAGSGRGTVDYREDDEEVAAGEWEAEPDEDQPPAGADRGAPATPLADDPIGCYEAGDDHEGSSSSEEDWNLYFGSDLDDDVCAECALPISPHELSMAVCHSWTGVDGQVRSRTCGCRVHRPLVGNAVLITQCLHGPRGTIISYVDDGGSGPARSDSASSSEEDSSHSDFSGSELDDHVCAECELPISPHELSMAVRHTWTDADGAPRSWICGCRVHRPVEPTAAPITQCLHGPKATVITYVDDVHNAPAPVGGGI